MSFIHFQREKGKSISPIKRTLIFLIIIAIIAVSSFIAIKNNVLFGNDKIAYEFIVEYIFTFKEPSSVRLVSGSVHNSDMPQDPSLYCGISATNGYGGRTTSYYLFSTYTSQTGMKEYPKGCNIEAYITRDELNIDLINRKIQKFLKSGNH